MGSGVFNGAFTTGVGFVPLLWAQMPMFVVFAQVFMMIISLGLLHGFIALPLMLAQWGPPPVTVHHSAGHDDDEGDGHGLAYAPRSAVRASRKLAEPLGPPSWTLSAPSRIPSRCA